MGRLGDYERRILSGREDRLKQICEEDILFTYVMERRRL